MQYVRSYLLTVFTLLLPLLSLLPLPSLTESDDQYVSCGSLLGDKRYCLDYSNKELLQPPDGWNITTELDLSHNKIRVIDAFKFKDQLLLMKLDLSNNEIVNIDVKALQNLRSLTELKLGSNNFLCDVTICPLRNWIISNMHKVKDIESVACSAPIELKGKKLIDLNANTLCRNGTIHHGFEINTGTVFMIWIVVPIMITCLTALYIVLNGNNRVGIVMRGSFLACCQRCCISPRRRADGGDQQADRDDPPPPPPRHQHDDGITRELYSAPSLEELQDYMAPVENTVAHDILDMQVIRPGPSSSLQW